MKWHEKECGGSEGVMCMLYRHNNECKQYVKAQYYYMYEADNTYITDYFVKLVSVALCPV